MNDLIKVLIPPFIILLSWNCKNNSAQEKPVMILPEPTGQYIVGTTNLYLTDSSRLEVLSTDDTTDFRRLSIRCWYPSDLKNKGKNTIPYCSEAFYNALLKQKNVPDSLVRHMLYAKTHSYKNIPVSDKEARYPIVVFMHGNGIHSNLYTSTSEELASHGFIIFSINATYNCILAEFPDTNIYSLDTGEDPPDSIKKLFQYAYSLGSKYDSTIDKIERLRIKTYLEKESILKMWYAENEIWVNDFNYMITELQTINNDSNDIFFNKLDLNNIAAGGMSKGGGQAVHVCKNNKSVKVGFSMDGNPDFLESAVTKPFLLLTTFDTKVPLYKQFFTDCYHVRIEGTSHGSFGDNQLIVKNPDCTTKPERSIEITNKFLVAFLSKFLKNNETVKLEDMISCFPEIDFKIY
jgi:hypothetical protein